MSRYNTTPPIHVLRGILRHLKKSCPSSNTPETVAAAVGNHGSEGSIQQYVLSQYREAKEQSLTPGSPVALQRRRLAYDYYQLISNLTERGRLHGLDGGAEKKLSPKEFTRRAAARAGFMIPETYVDSGSQ